MTAHDFFMEAANRYGPRPDMVAEGVKSWGDVQEVARAVNDGTADPLNNIYDDDKRFDVSPRSSGQANRAHNYKLLDALLRFSLEVEYGTQMLISIPHPASFSTPEQTRQRVKEAQSIGNVLNQFMAAAKELSDGVTDPLEFSKRHEDEVHRLYRRNNDILRRVDPTLDRIVNFVNREFQRQTGGALEKPFRNVIRSLAHIGRLTIKGNNGGDGQPHGPG